MRLQPPPHTVAGVPLVGLLALRRPRGTAVRLVRPFQPLGPATLCSGGCNPMYAAEAATPYVVKAATLCARACNRIYRKARVARLRGQGDLLGGAPMYRYIDI